MEQIEKREFADFIADVPFSGSSLYQDKLFISEMRWLPELPDTILPMRLNAFSLIMVERGELTINIDYRPFRVRENMFFVLIDKHIVQPGCASEDFKGYHLVATHDFARGVTDDKKPPMSGTVNPLQQSPVIGLEAAEFAVLRDSLERLRCNIHRDDHAYQQQLVRHALADLLFELWNFTMLKSEKEATKNKVTPREDMIARFFDLLFEHGRKEHDVAFYAAALCVTPVYLSRAIKHVTGKPAIKVINDIVLTDAKILLHRPNITMQQIAEELNFADQASFSKFFKKHTGEAPIVYKRKMR